MCMKIFISSMFTSVNQCPKITYFRVFTQINEQLKPWFLGMHRIELGLTYKNGWQ